MVISFAVWSPDEATFWASWITAGICTAPGEFAPGYTEVQTTAGSWPGVVTKTTLVEGESVATEISGWHCNVRVFGALADEMTYELNQTDEDGNLLDVFDRTWASNIFQLIEQPADPTTGFPAGYRNSVGVTYCDVRDLKSPSNVWA